MANHCLMSALVFGIGAYWLAAVTTHAHTVPDYAEALTPGVTSFVEKIPLQSSSFVGTSWQNSFKTADVTPGTDRLDLRPSGPVETVPVKMGNLILNIPRGYIASMDGYRRDFDYVRLWALLPCLLPETDQDHAEFHQNTLGKVLVMTLGGGETGLVGQDLLDVRRAHNNLEKVHVESSKFQLYKNNLLSLDTYVLNDSNPIFVDECVMHLKYIPYPSCSVRERIWGDVLLNYTYNRSFVDIDLENIIRIDKQVRALLDSFANPPIGNLQTDDSRAHEEGLCK